MKKNHLLLAGLLLGAAPWAASAEEVAQKFIPEGVTQRVGGYRPARAEMSDDATLVTKAPEGLEAPKYGKIELGEKSWAFVLDEPADKPAKLFVDTNADGDLTNDPETKWEAREQMGLKMYTGSSQIDLGDGQLGSLGMYRFDPNDDRRGELKNTVLFYTDYGYEYTFKLDDQEFSTFVAGQLGEEGRLPVDRDGNGATSFNYEMITLGKAFNFTGTSHLMTVKDGKLHLETSDEQIPVAPLPPDLTLGKKALEFAAATMEGSEVEFPKTYAGKLVMLDFWATWCGPCIGEIPNMKKAYADHHENGFEILGVSLDSEGEEEAIKEVMKEHEITWSQIYQGRRGEDTLAAMHDISAIPFVLLVDGDTGEIIGTSRELRGEGLSDYIAKQLEKKKAPPATE